MVTTVVRYIGSQHPHLAGLEGVVASGDPREERASIVVEWRWPGGSVRPHCYSHELRVLRGFTKAFR